MNEPLCFVVADDEICWATYAEHVLAFGRRFESLIRGPHEPLPSLVDRLRERVAALDAASTKLDRVILATHEPATGHEGELLDALVSCCAAHGAKLVVAVDRGTFEPRDVDFLAAKLARIAKGRSIEARVVEVMGDVPPFSMSASELERLRHEVRSPV